MTDVFQACTLATNALCIAAMRNGLGLHVASNSAPAMMDLI